MIWIGAIALAFVLYLLTYPIVFVWSLERSGIFPGFHARSPSSLSAPPAPSGFTNSWVFYYGMPYFLLSSVPPFEEPMRRYLQWWAERMILGGGMRLPAP
jgi:hypothetical protein